MPIVNIFYKNSNQQKGVGPQFILNSLKDELKSFVAQELTCKDIKLKPEEISLRLINISGDGMIGNIEIEITAYSFKERVQKRDQICLNIAKFFQQKNKSLGEVKIWLVLAELGHSWEKSTIE